ncbi:MAG: cell division protein FtsB [Oceanicoccus sp.]|jgi:cell division protein FtsB
MLSRGGFSAPVLFILPRYCASVSANNNYYRLSAFMTMRLILLLLLMLLAALQYRLWFGQGSWEQIVSLEREIEEQQLINQRQKDRNGVLEDEVRDLKSGMESVEERARSDLGLIKKDETFYLIVEDKK